MASALAGISLLDNPSDDPAKRRQQMEAWKAAQNLGAGQCSRQRYTAVCGVPSSPGLLSPDAGGYYTPTLAPSLSAACDPSIWRICWQSCGSKPIQEATAQKYLTVASAVLQRRQAKRDLGKEPCPHSAASDPAVHPARPDPCRGAEAPRRPGERVPALPAVLSPAHLVHRLPARRTVRSAMGRH